MFEQTKVTMLTEKFMRKVSLPWDTRSYVMFGHLFHKIFPNFCVLDMRDDFIFGALHLIYSDNLVTYFGFSHEKLLGFNKKKK